MNTGARAENVAEFLRVADGVIVGSSLKQDGYTWNPVDGDRVRAFMDQVNRARKA
jgi:predicted TIM-barrel enzyme